MMSALKFTSCKLSSAKTALDTYEEEKKKYIGYLYIYTMAVYSKINVIKRVLRSVKIRESLPRMLGNLITSCYVSRAVYSKLIQSNPGEQWCPRRILPLRRGPNITQRLRRTDALRPAPPGAADWLRHAQCPAVIGATARIDVRNNLEPPGRRGP